MRRLVSNHRMIAHLAAFALAAVSRMIVAWLVFGPLFPIWIAIDPGRPLAYWIIETRWSNFAPFVRHFSAIYLPDTVLSLISGVILGWLFPKRWVSTCAVLAISVGLLLAAAGIDSVSSFLSARWLPQWQAIVVTCVAAILLHGAAFPGGWIGARLGRRRLAKEGGCSKCGYLLVGLSSSRCPECGSPFDAPISGPAVVVNEKTPDRHA